MGGAVNATAGNNRIWGVYPDIIPNTGPTGLDRGRGVVIPQVSSDAYHANCVNGFVYPITNIWRQFCRISETSIARALRVILLAF